MYLCCRMIILMSRVVGNTGKQKYVITEMKTLRHGSNDPDTRHWWNLAKHVFRYGHLGGADAYNGADTINEGQKVPACGGLNYSFAWELQLSEQKDSWSKFASSPGSFSMWIKVTCWSEGCR